MFVVGADAGPALRDLLAILTCWCGMMTPRWKGVWLRRLDDLWSMYDVNGNAPDWAGAASSRSYESRPRRTPSWRDELGGAREAYIGAGGPARAGNLARLYADWSLIGMPSEGVDEGRNETILTTRELHLRSVNARSAVTCITTSDSGRRASRWTTCSAKTLRVVDDNDLPMTLFTG